MKFLQLWWALLRLGVFGLLPFALGFAILMLSPFMPELNQGVLYMVMGVFTLLLLVSVPLCVFVGMFPASRPDVGTELPSAMALRARLIFGGLAMAVWAVSLGFPWVMVCILSHISIPHFLKYAIPIGACVLHGVALWYGYFSRCSVCAAYAVSVRPLYPEGTLCRCRRCGAFSCWRSE